MKFTRPSLWLAALVVALACLVSSAHAAKVKKDLAPEQATPSKPVVQYIVMVVLIALPVAAVCRSARR
jgi:hypothetical protein